VVGLIGSVVSTYGDALVTLVASDPEVREGGHAARRRSGSLGGGGGGGGDSASFGESLSRPRRRSIDKQHAAPPSPSEEAPAGANVGTSPVGGGEERGMEAVEEELRASNEERHRLLRERLSMKHAFDLQNAAHEDRYAAGMAKLDQWERDRAFQGEERQRLLQEVISYPALLASKRWAGCERGASGWVDALLTPAGVCLAQVTRLNALLKQSASRTEGAASAAQERLAEIAMRGSDLEGRVNEMEEALLDSQADNAAMDLKFNAAVEAREAVEDELEGRMAQLQV